MLSLIGMDVRLRAFESPLQIGATSDAFIAMARAKHI